MVSIAIASGHEHDREEMAALLSQHDNFRIAAIGKDGYDALWSAMKDRPDIIIMDLIMDDADSLELAPVIKRHSPATGIIVLCSHVERSALYRAIRAGISGYLSKQEGYGNLAPSVWSVYHGGLYISRPARSEEADLPAVHAQGARVKQRAFPAFTPTELGILSGIALGLTDIEIASSLNITVGTLRNYVNQAKKKTGFRNRTQIIIYALLNGMIRLGKGWRQHAAA